MVWSRGEEVVWCGVCVVVWRGIVWYGVYIAWCGVLWCGMVWYGVAWVWHGVVWRPGCSQLRCGVLWCSMLLSSSQTLQASAVRSTRARSALWTAAQQRSSICPKCFVRSPATISEAQQLLRCFASLWRALSCIWLLWFALG